MVRCTEVQLTMGHRSGSRQGRTSSRTYEPLQRSQFPGVSDGQGVLQQQPKGLRLNVGLLSIEAPVSPTSKVLLFKVAHDVLPPEAFRVGSKLTHPHRRPGDKEAPPIVYLGGKGVVPAIDPKRAAQRAQHCARNNKGQTTLGAAVQAQMAEPPVLWSWVLRNLFRLHTQVAPRLRMQSGTHCHFLAGADLGLAPLSPWITQGNETQPHPEHQTDEATEQGHKERRHREHQVR
mmetsp:Transcript_25213/g.58730  ORF Transcript_25213/g.58730 Transcript_25213/m.58730 type:complete len:233 (-) Transcript_25213:1159-1857(-)